MSCYFRQNSNCEITVPKFRTIESQSVVYYDIKIKVGQIEWLVTRRYKDFDNLNEKLVEEISISKKLLPPKKIVGNKNPAFLEQRRAQLEKYLKELLIFFRIQLPRVLAEFLEFNRYDIIYLLQDLAEHFNENGESLLRTKKEFHFSALEVYAISERLNLPCPPESIEHRGKFDFSHVLDVCSQLEVIQITPVKGNEDTFGNDYNTVDVPIGRSNIIPKNLKFNLNAFRNLICLKIFAIPSENIIDIALLKPSLQKICVHNTTITSINQVLLCDDVHKDTSIDVPSTEDISLNRSSTCMSNSSPSLAKTAITTNRTWYNVTELDFTSNLLTHIDESIRTVPQIRVLSLEQNRLRNIKNLAELPHLQVLNLSINLIADCNDWHLELGNLVTLNLSQNKLKCIRGLRRLLSLVNLDISCNLIDDLEEVDNIASLPLLETLRLTGNPLASSVDYRPRVLSRFHERASEIVLDSEKGSQKELDTALVLSAILISRLRQKSQQ
ncbi:nischarin [Musca vetustissima]|uniref:nischarin n=1 Tax=Musca vetustissima TaxID=27455 RepID=UPI002AB6F663|nr:nischarin [Musca vetustissima]